jgi:uncharacterized protein YceK
MKKAIVGVVLALIVACSLGGCGAAEAQTKGKGDRWGYKNVPAGGGSVEGFNDLGAEGWELVMVGGGYWFKRKLP